MVCRLPKEICQHCELKFHCPGGKWAHHPPRRELLPIEDSPPTLLDHSQAARQRYEFIWFLPLMQTLTNTRRTRQDMYKELFLEVSQRNAAKEELKIREKDTKERAKLRAITIFQSLWRRWYVQKGNSVLGTLNLRERRSLLQKQMEEKVDRHTFVAAQRFKPSTEALPAAHGLPHCPLKILKSIGCDSGRGATRCGWQKASDPCTRQRKRQ